jgi:hypothetical protein
MTKTAGKIRGRWEKASGSLLLLQLTSRHYLAKSKTPRTFKQITLAFVHFGHYLIFACIASKYASHMPKEREPANTKVEPPFRVLGLLSRTRIC